MPRPVPAARRLVRIAVIALVTVGLATTGCGVGEPRSIDPSGVDGLEIPTPSPDPADFVAGIDNPYLPLAAGSEWVYESETLTATVTVDGDTREIAGVAATEVTTVVERRRTMETTTRYFAQDRAGNVWSFGADEWQAGVAGAQAGLVMPASPRVGDGFLQHRAAGVAEDRSVVLDVAVNVSVPYDSWTTAIEIRETTGPEPELETVRYYAPGVGLVRTVSDTGVLELVSFTPGS
jgi:hypothetical protein